MKWLALLVVVLLASALVGAAWAGADQAEPQVRLELDLTDGSCVIGIPSIETVSVETVYAKMNVPLKRIASMKIEADHETAAFEMRNGDTLKGVVTLAPIELETVFGNSSIGVERIRAMRVVLLGRGLSDAAREALVLHFAFDLDEGDKVADLSGTKHHGTSKGAKWAPKGKVGGAFQVGKQVGHVEAPNHEAWSLGMNPFSIGLWINLNQPPSGEQMLVGHDDGGGSSNKWVFGFSNGELYFHINNTAGAGSRIVGFPWVPETGKWQHVAVTRNGTAYSLYVNGVSVATGLSAVAIPVAGAPLTVGQAEGLYVEGLLDEVMIFHCALTDKEVRQIYDAQK